MCSHIADLFLRTELLEQADSGFNTHSTDATESTLKEPADKLRGEILTPSEHWRHSYEGSESTGVDESEKKIHQHVAFHTSPLKTHLLPTISHNGAAKRGVIAQEKLKANMPICATSVEKPSSCDMRLMPTE